MMTGFIILRHCYFYDSCCEFYQLSCLCTGIGKPVWKLQCLLRRGSSDESWNDEARPLVVVSALSFLQCFGWVTRKDIRHVRTCALSSSFEWHGSWWVYWPDSTERIAHYTVLVHGQVTIIFVVSVGLSVCLFVQSFSQPSLIQFRSNLDICCMSGSGCVP